MIPENCLVKNIDQGFYRKVYRFALDKLQFSRLRKYKYDLVLYDKEVVKIRRENGDFGELFKDHNSIYLETCRHFFHGSAISDYLTINPAIVNEAKKIYSSFNNSTYGVHIRSTDNTMSQKHSPPSAFKNMIREKLQEESGALFFLATDSKLIENEFVAEFKENLLINNHDDFDRNSKVGIKNALIDMVCLSKTQKVYGSYFSSFSYISAKLSGIECENVISENTNLNLAKS